MSQDGISGSHSSPPGAWDQCGDPQAEIRMPMLVEQGEEAMQNLLGQGDGEEGPSFLEQCASSSAPTLEDVRNSHGQVGLSSEEQHAADWSAQVMSLVGEQRCGWCACARGAWLSGAVPDAI